MFPLNRNWPETSLGHRTQTSNELVQDQFRIMTSPFASKWNGREMKPMTSWITGHKLTSIPSRELTYPTLGKGTSSLNPIFGGYVGSLEGIPYFLMETSQFIKGTYIVCPKTQWRGIYVLLNLSPVCPVYVKVWGPICGYNLTEHIGSKLCPNKAWWAGGKI